MKVIAFLSCVGSALSLLEGQVLGFKDVATLESRMPSTDYGNATVAKRANCLPFATVFIDYRKRWWSWQNGQAERDGRACSNVLLAATKKTCSLDAFIATRVGMCTCGLLLGNAMNIPVNPEALNYLVVDHYATHGPSGQVQVRFFPRPRDVAGGLVVNCAPEATAEVYAVLASWWDGHDGPPCDDAFDGRHLFHVSYPPQN